jgi:hypothetical protein
MSAHRPAPRHWGRCAVVATPGFQRRGHRARRCRDPALAAREEAPFEVLGNTDSSCSDGARGSLPSGVPGFLRYSGIHVLTRLDANVVDDRYAWHKHSELRAWLFARPRSRLPFAPTDTFCFNQVARWLVLLDQRSVQGAYLILLQGRARHCLCGFRSVSESELPEIAIDEAIDSSGIGNGYQDGERE